MATVEEVKKKLDEHLPGAQIQVSDMTGTQNHYSVEVISDRFKEKSKLEQHQMIYAALGEEIKGEIHALQIKTSIP